MVQKNYLGCDPHRTSTCSVSLIIIERLPLYLHLFLLLSLVLPISVLQPASAYGIEPFRIGTGGKTGVYFPIGRVIAMSLTDTAQQEESALHGFIGVAQNSAGSIENVTSIAHGDIEAGLVQADVAAFAFNGNQAFAGDKQLSSIRAIASLYAEQFQIVVRKDAGIKSFYDLKDKRISVDELGSGTLAVMRIILEGYGLTEQDFQPVYLKPVFTHDKLKDGSLQGFVMMAGTPMAAVTELLDTGVTLVPIERSVANEISVKYPYLHLGKIRGGTYRTIPETDTLEVYALLLVDESMSEDLAYEITRSLFTEETSSRLSNGHPQGRAITLETALNGISIPFHPGAKKYYRQSGMIK